MEWTCLEQICLYTAGHARLVDVVEQLALDGFSFGTLLEEALRHKVHLVAAAALLEPACAAYVTEKWRWVLSGMVAQNLTRNRSLGRHAAVLSAALAEAGVRAVARKGLFLEPCVYGGKGLRWLSDLDFMVALEDRKAVEVVAAACGYQPGVVDRGVARIVPHDRRYLLTLATSPDHLPRCGKLVDDAGVDYLDVDWATSFTWWKGDYEVDLAPALASASAAPGQGVLTFSPEYNLLDVLLHFFREAFFETTVLSKAEPLIGFLDILMLCRRHAAELADGAFGEFCRRLGVELPCAWVLTHLDRALGTDVASPLGLAGVASEQFLSSWRRSGGSLATWRGDMRQRMRASDRRRFFLNESAG
jgi:hypothetical protein